MMYVSPQDAAIARAAAAKAEADAAQADRRADYSARQELGRALFRDSRLHHLDELVRAQLNRERGHVGPHELDQEGAVMSRRWVVCRVCGHGFAPRTVSQDVCGLACFCRDRRHLVGWPTRLRQEQRKRMRAAA